MEVFWLGLLNQYLPCPLLKVLHLCVSVVKYDILLILFILLVLLRIASLGRIRSFLLNSIVFLVLIVILVTVFVVADVLSYEKRVIVAVCCWREILLRIFRESHLLVVRRREHIL